MGKKQKLSINNTPQQPGSGTPITNYRGTVPVVANTPDADSIMTQPKYNLKPLIEAGVDKLPDDMFGALNYLTPKIKGHMANLDKALAAYRVKNPDAKALPYDEGVRSIGAPAYKDYIDAVNVYNKYRSKTNLDPREVTNKWGLTGSFGNSNSGGGLNFGATQDYDETLQNLYKSYVTPLKVPNNKKP